MALSTTPSATTSPAVSEKDQLIERLLDESNSMRREMERVKNEDRVVVVELRNQVYETEAELAAVRSLLQQQEEENAQMRRSETERQMPVNGEVQSTYQ